MELIGHFVLFCLVLISLNSVANATCECTMIDDAICCDGNTYSSKCDALCNGGYDNCKPNKGPCEGNRCCDGQCTPGACPSGGKPGKESSLTVSDCDPASDPEDTICCEGTTFRNKCDANHGDILECKPDKGLCDSGDSCCGGRCYQIDGGCPSGGKPGKESSLTVSDCDYESDAEDTICCEGTTFRNKCEANVNGGILECKPAKGTCSGGSCCDGRCYQIDGGCPYSAKVMPRYSGLLSLSKSYGSTEQWNMTIIVILLVVFSGCFLFLGLSVGAFYLRETKKIDYVNQDKEKSCESDW